MFLPAIRQLKSVKSSLTREALHSLIHAFVHCRLDYCNSALAGVAKVYLQKLQYVVVCERSLYD